MESSPLYNSSVFELYLKMLENRYPHVDIEALLDHVGITRRETTDQRHWFTQQQADRMHDRLVQLTGNRDIAREAGRYATSPEALGIMSQYLLSNMGPANVFRLISKTAAKLTRSATYESKKLSPNQIEVIVTPRPGIEEKAYQCKNRMGFFEASLLMFSYKLPQIHHPECLFEGGSCCRYQISWANNGSAVWIRARNLLLIGSIPFLALLLKAKPDLFFHFALPLLTAISFLLTLVADAFEKTNLRTSLAKLRDTTEQLVDQIGTTHNNALLNRELAQSIGVQTHLEEILDSAIRTLQQRLDFERGLILLTDPVKPELTFRAGFGFSSDELRTLEQTHFHLEEGQPKGLFARALLDKKPFMVNNLKDLPENSPERRLVIAHTFGAPSFICCPILCDQKAIGILAVAQLKTARPLIQTDVNLLMGIAPVIGISLHNVQLLEARARQFETTLQVLAASIDARDPMTAGHSKMVSEYSLEICRQLRLPKDFCQMLRIAALLHDYGKIGVPDHILKKPGRLTADEFDEIKEHSARSRTILEAIQFDGIYQQIPEIAGAHHEKLDGSGYPHGLRGEQIPLGARILSVADVFEALTAKRHYRDPMPVGEAVNLLRAGIGTHFDAEIVEALIRSLDLTESNEKGQHATELRQLTTSAA